LDILYSYLPAVRDYFGEGSLGTPAMFAYLARAPKLNWSLLRGFQDPLLLALAQAAWLGSTVVVLLGLWGRLTAADAGPHPGLRRRRWRRSACAGGWPAPSCPASSAGRRRGGTASRRSSSWRWSPGPPPPSSSWSAGRRASAPWRRGRCPCRSTTSTGTSTTR